MRWYGSWRIRTQLAAIMAVALSPAAVLLVSAYHRSPQGVAWLALVTLLAALLAWRMWRSGPARRLDHVLAVAQALGRGDLSARAPLDEAEHELGPLARALDEAAQALRGSEQQLRDLLELLPLAASITDAEGGVRMVNHQHVALFGYPPESIPDAEAWFRLTQPDPASQHAELAQWRDDLAEAARRGAATPCREYRVRCADGTTRDVEITHRPLGHLGVTVYVDVTERNGRAREHLVSERERLVSQSQASLGTLAGGVAHDFNNLLTTIIGGIELATLANGEDAPGADELRLALSAAQRAADLTSQMLAYSGQGVRQLADVDLGYAARRAAGAMLPVMGERADLNLALASSLPLFRSDPIEIERLIVSLITNGLEAVPADRHGSVTVRTGLAEYDAAALASSRTPRPPRPGAFVWVEVRDDGVGMDDETQRRLFEPFYSTKFAGRGLSLPAVQGIVGSCGGAIFIDSQPGQGTTVRVLFPPDNDGEPCVLVVDDDDDVRDLAVSFATRCGWRAIGVADGAAALAEAARLGRQLRVVLLDLSMPDRDGRAVLADLRALSAALPVVVCSGHDRAEALADLAQLKPSGFLSKPFTMASFEQALQAAALA
ncbi:MAG: response regulator [Armatimonadetes bacterium]|nr:response regulator [Armatimonadota bacterium]